MRWPYVYGDVYYYFIFFIFFIYNIIIIMMGAQFKFGMDQVDIVFLGKRRFGPGLSWEIYNYNINLDNYMQLYVLLPGIATKKIKRASKKNNDVVVDFNHHYYTKY